MVVPHSRSYQGRPLFANSFRPFFLFGSIQAALAILVWLPVFHGEIVLTSAFAPLDWHMHEMIYGFLPAVVTGFLFTAIPNWTGRLPIRGTPLAVLVVVWIVGRLAVTFSAGIGWAVAFVIDASFLALVAAATAREIVTGRNWRNLIVVLLVLLMLTGNIVFHLEAHFRDAANYGIRIGIAVVVALLSLIGGRIIPSFTRNWLVRENPGRLPVPFGPFDKVVTIFSAVTLLCWIVLPEHKVTGALAIAAGVLHLVRLSRWAGHRTTRERLLLILHIGYVFVPLGFLLQAAAVFGPLAPSAGIHAWMAGAAGIMTLAVMTRASLGHTGQALTASVVTQVIYAAVIVAALARICAAVHPAFSDVLLHVAAGGWVVAFGGFALAFGPLLLGSRCRALAVAQELRRKS